MSAALLEVDRVSVERGGFTIVRDVSLRADAGSVTVLLGANGAGKTTLLEALSGVIPVSRGSVGMSGVDITTSRRRRRARLGMAHVEQGRTVFADLTTEQNLLVAAAADRAERAYEVFPALRERREVLARDLSGGEQQMLVLARAIIAGPQLLLLDEISLGLAPVVLRSLMPVVRQLADTGIGVLLVEQFAELALDYGDAAYVLHRGSVAFGGTCDELRRTPELLHGAYLAEGGS